MLEINDDFKKKTVVALIEARQRYNHKTAEFCTKYKISPSVWSRLQGGEIEGLLTVDKWVAISQKLGVNQNERQWNLARTDVFTTIEEDILFCQVHSKSLMCVDDCGIGKTFTATYLCRTLSNCFYIDSSQSKGKIDFVKALAKEIGVSASGKTSEIKDNIKYVLRNLPKPIVIIDEAGDMNPPTLLEVKELWNATEGVCGWYMMGAEGLKRNMDRGMQNKKPGFRKFLAVFQTDIPLLFLLINRKK